VTAAPPHQLAKAPAEDSAPEAQTSAIPGHCRDGRRSRLRIPGNPPRHQRRITFDAALDREP
jgi:hypothetical protein